MNKVCLVYVYYNDILSLLKRSKLDLPCDSIGFSLPSISNKTFLYLIELSSGNTQNFEFTVHDMNNNGIDPQEKAQSHIVKISKIIHYPIDFIQTEITTLRVTLLSLFNTVKRIDNPIACINTILSKVFDYPILFDMNTRILLNPMFDKSFTTLGSKKITIQDEDELLQYIESEKIFKVRESVTLPDNILEKWGIIC